MNGFNTRYNRGGDYIAFLNGPGGRVDQRVNARNNVQLSWRYSDIRTCGDLKCTGT